MLESRVKTGLRKQRVSREAIPKARPRKSKWLPSIPEVEVYKAHRRNMSHADAVRECAALTELFQGMGVRKPIMVELSRILDALRAKKIPFVLTGAHGISGWTGRPRATKDVDILVKSGRNYVRAVNAIKALYPQLEVRNIHGVTAFFAPGEFESLIDITYPQREDNAETLRTAVWVEDDKGKYRVPALEAALANKYGAMLSLGRDPGKRGLDAVDFYNMVKHSMDQGRTPIDLERLAELGEKVWPGGGGKEILGLVEQVMSGKLPSVAVPEPPTS